MYNAFHMLFVLNIVFLALLTKQRVINPESRFKNGKMIFEIFLLAQAFKLKY